MKPAPFIALTLCLCSAMALAHPHPHTPAEEMAHTARNFLASLTAEQREKTVIDFKDGERRNWNFVPMVRRGIPLKELSHAQRHLAQALLASGLSHRGLIKAHTIINLEEILHEMEGGAPRRDPELYYVAIFGEPSERATWGWRFEGHHLSINFTIVDGKEVSPAPSFFGANPAEVRQGPQTGLRALGAEEGMGRHLVQSLSPEQRQVAIFQETAPRDIITGNARRIEPLPLAGIPASQMTAEQKDHLMVLIEEYVRRHRPELADKDLEQIRQAGFEKVHFGWAGAIEPGRGHYYRVQGPTFLLEYDNTQNNANHIHSVWRDFEGDFGEDLLRRHYEAHSHD